MDGNLEELTCQPTGTVYETFQESLIGFSTSFGAFVGLVYFAIGVAMQAGGSPPEDVQKAKKDVLENNFEYCLDTQTGNYDYLAMFSNPMAIGRGTLHLVLSPALDLGYEFSEQFLDTESKELVLRVFK